LRISTDTTFVPCGRRTPCEPADVSNYWIGSEYSQAISSKALIQQGFGLGWLPRSLAQEKLQQGKLHIAGGTQWHIGLQIRLYRRRNDANTKLQNLWQMLIKTVS